MSKTKVCLMWLPKRCRKPKMVGTATAACSALSIRDFTLMAEQGKGRLWIVEAPTAADARAAIKLDKDGQSVAGMKTVVGNVTAIGIKACMALAGASQSIRNWDANIAKHGIVPIEETKALTKDALKAWNLDNVFGQGLK